LGKEKIETLKMGGLLAVNRGSQDPPQFCILEWRSAAARNVKPIVLIGKGVVFDTGGLSLKPTEGMDYMKCDMGGAAAVAGTLAAVASNNLPIHRLRKPFVRHAVNLLMRPTHLVRVTDHPSATRLSSPQAQHERAPIRR